VKLAAGLDMAREVWEGAPSAATSNPAILADKPAISADFGCGAPQTLPERQPCHPESPIATSGHAAGTCAALRCPPHRNRQPADPI